MLCFNYFDLSSELCVLNQMQVSSLFTEKFIFDIHV